jgi:VIT1/CCC1 family predicted Fe2+/Mn2+ transporter
MLTRNLEKAREAYRAGSAEMSRRAHESPPPEPHRREHGRYVKSLVYGGLDGIVTTFAVVAGAAGAKLSAGVVLIMGFANLIADGLSMAVGDYLSTKAEQEYQRTERARESWEAENFPEGEKREMVEVYTAKGVPEEEARTVVEVLSRYPKAWVDVMMMEELGIVESDDSPVRNAAATFVAFAVLGFVPLAAFVLARMHPAVEARQFLIACVLTGVTLFALGAMKVWITGRNWFFSGVEMFIVGGLAAAAAYAVGAALSGLIGAGA